MGLAVVKEVEGMRDKKRIARLLQRIVRKRAFDKLRIQKDPKSLQKASKICGWEKRRKGEVEIRGRIE